jgi:hypothetical protein
MNREVVQLLAKSGLVPEDALQQFYKWKMVDDVGKIDQPKSAKELVDRINAVLEEDGMTLVRVTDIDIVNRYFSTQTIGKLVLVTEGELAQSSTVEVAFGKTLTGEIVFPWRGDSITNLMTNGLTHLLIEKKAKGLTVMQAIYFSDVKEAYFGTMKAFMICTPSSVEQEGGDGDVA